MATTVRLREQAVRDIAKLHGAHTIAAIGRLIGVSESYMHRLMRGERPCSWDRCIALAAALRVDPTTIADIATEAA